MDFKQRPLNQSLISRFLYKGEEREDTCPSRIFLVDIIKEFDYHTESMHKGSYFETLCIGKGAGGRRVTDLPRKKLVKKQELENELNKLNGFPEIQGEKTIDQVRIEEQAATFKVLSAKYQITVFPENSQVKVIIPWAKNPDVMLSMEFDLFPTTIMTNEKLFPEDSGLRLAIIDIKLTADIHTTFGDYCWGAPEFLDPIQALMYHYGARQAVNHVDLNPHLTDILTKPAVEGIRNNHLQFFYWVFNYKKKLLENKLIKVNWDTLREYELNETINKVVALIDMYEQQGWPTKPQFKLCRECPVTNCKDRQAIQEI